MHRLEELIPRNDVERAYAQACHWAPMRAWTRGTLDLNRNRVGMAAAKYLAMAKKSLQNGDYDTTLSTLQSVQSYGELLTPEETISMVRMLCDILSLIIEKANPDLAEVQKEAVVASAHFIAGLKGEKNAVVECMTQLRRSGGVDLLSERAAINQTKEIRQNFERCKTLCAALVSEENPDNSLKTLTGATKTLTKTIRQYSHDRYEILILGMLSECRMFLDALANRVDAPRISRCRSEVESCFNVICADFIRLQQEDSVNTSSYGEQAISLDLSLFKTIYEHRKTSHQRDIRNLQQHLVTLVSLCALNKRHQDAASVAESMRAFILGISPPQAELNQHYRVNTHLLVPTANTELVRVCTQLNYVFSHTSHIPLKDSDFIRTLIILAEKNFNFEQNQLAGALLNRVLDRFGLGDIGVAVVEEIWRQSIEHLAKYWQRIESDFILPLIALTELHVGEKAELAAIYRGSFFEIQAAAGIDAESTVLRHLVTAREHLQGNSSVTLIPLLCRAAQNANIRSNTAQCLELCNRVVQIIKASLIEGVVHEHIDDLLFCAKYQLAHQDSEIEQTFNLISQCFETVDQNKAISALYSICDFIKLQCEEDFDKCPQLSAILEQLGQERLNRLFEDVPSLPNRFTHENAIIVISRLSQRNGWDLHTRFLPLLSVHASYSLSNREFEEAQRLYKLIVSIEPSKTAMLSHAFVLAQQNQIDEATAVLELVLTDPVPEFSDAEMERLEMILSKCSELHRGHSIKRFITQLLPSRLISETQNMTERYGQLLFSAVGKGNLETAETLLQGLPFETKDKFDVVYDGILNFLSASQRFTLFTNYSWQPPHEGAEAYPLLSKLKSDVIVYYRMKQSG